MANHIHVSQKKIEELLKLSLAESIQVNVDEIDTHKSFTEYGMNSISAISLSGELSDKLHTDIQPTLFWDYQNIDSLAHHIVDEMKIIDENNTIKQTKSVMSTARSTAKPQHKTHIKPHNMIVEIVQLDKMRAQMKKASGKDLYFTISDELKSESLKHNHEFINFSVYDYLGFANDPSIKKAAIEAIKKYGTTVSASRVAGGEKDIHRELEKEISRFLGTEDTIVFNSGHATNVTTIGHVMKKGDLIICDELSHNSILQGAKLSQAEVMKFKHNDPSHLEELLELHHANYDKILIVLEGLYSMDGDFPDLPTIIALKKQYQALLYIDEAHSLGVLGNTGRGIMEYWQVNPADVDFSMGTLGKAIAAIGGYISGKKELINYLKFTAPGFVYSIGLTPSQTATALASIQKLRLHPEIPKNLRRKAKLLVSLLRRANINCGHCMDMPVIPILVGGSHQALQVCNELRENGIFAQAIVYPAVEDQAARIRLFLSVNQSDKTLKKAAKIIAAVCHRS